MLRAILLLSRIPGLTRLVTRLMLDRRVPLRLKLILPAALLYFIFPRDIIPDILPAFGRIDDILVIVIAVALFLVMAPKDIVSEHTRSGRMGPSSRDRSSQSDPPVIDGKSHIVDDE